MSFKTFAVGFIHLVLSFVLMASCRQWRRRARPPSRLLGLPSARRHSRKSKRVPVAPSSATRHQPPARDRCSKRKAGRSISGLQDVWFVFDEREVLVGVQMTMAKNDFDHVYQNLAGKYRLVRKDIPFVGNKSARFQQGDIVIDFNAPHMSFEMEVVYRTIGFEKQVEQGSRQEAAQKQKREAGKF